MEVHGANPFKIRAYTSAVYNIEQQQETLTDKTLDELTALGFSKSITEKIVETAEKGIFTDLEQLIADTPEGVVKMLDIKGIGGKKIGTIWKELDITTLEKLEEACQANEIQKLKGFGAKTEVTILEQIQFLKQNKYKLLYAKAEPIALEILEYLKEKGFELIEVSGQIRRRMPVIDKIIWVIATEQRAELRKALEAKENITYNQEISGPLNWRGTINEIELPIEFKITTEEKFAQRLLLSSASGNHLALTNKEGKTLSQIVRQSIYPTEEAYYQEAELPFFPPELRDGLFETEMIKEEGLPQLVEMSDLKGILHNHSTYSDGRHSLEKMAVYCKELGYEYLGITDHSKSAFYANGLNEESIIKQHKEIDELNEKLAPFKIFKGIESDILNDGSLDYSEDVLASFDFIVSSIHSNLKMDIEKATNRLVTAIQNPYTTILGHPTGRLLLKREGYPIDHKTVIDACAEHDVVIEINTNPLRLDLDWKWVYYALSKGVKISINPDAHEMNGYHDMKYGLLVGRKAGLTKNMTFNALSLEEMDLYFKQKKAKTVV